jgi:hypothetical protein
VIPPLQPKKRTKRDAAEIFAACLAILVFLGLMVLFAFAAGRRRLADTDRNDAVSRPADTTPDDAVSNSYSWRWSDEPSYIGGVPTSVMMFDYPTYGSGFRLGLKLADYDDAGKWWDVYIYDYDVAGFVCVDSIQLTEAGVWTYADITFSERYVYSILIRPPTDEYGNWNEYSLFADVEQIRR